MKTLNIIPGQSIACDQETILTAIVSKGVLFCIRDRVTGCGGVASYIKPLSDSEECEDQASAEKTIPQLLKKLKDLGSQPKNLEIKILGGFSNQTIEEKAQSGANISAGLEWAAKFNILVEEEQHYSAQRYRIRYNTRSGGVLLQPWQEDQKEQSENQSFEHNALNETPKSLLLIGASTGGPQVIGEILSGLPDMIPPILIVQHISKGFSEMFAKRLHDRLPYEVKEAESGETLKMNQILIAPADYHLSIKQQKEAMITHVSQEEKMSSHRPSVDMLFDSAEKLRGVSILATLLTGMGRDGSQGLLKLKESGCETIVQDKKTSAIFGMGKEAIELGAANHILPKEEIAQFMTRWIAKKSHWNIPSSKVS